VSLFDPFAIQPDPFPTFAAARAAGGALRGVPPFPDVGQALYLFRHKQVADAMRDPTLLQSPAGSYQAVREQIVSHRVLAVLTRSMLFTDPPHHGPLRRPVAQPMGNSRLSDLSQWMRAEAARLAASAATRGRFDAIGDLASPFVVGVLERVLGLPLPPLADLKRATASIAAALDLRPETPDVPSHEACVWLEGEIQRALAAGAVEAGSVAASMLAEEQAGRWSRSDVVDNLVLLLLAGQETTIDAFGNAVLLLASAPEQRRLLQTGEVGWPQATEELMRLGTSVHYGGVRIVAHDRELEGVAVAAGSAVVPVLASANRDAAVFAQGESLDLRRPPKHGLTFGTGLHICLGQHLARLEVAILLEALFAQAPGWEVVTACVRQRPQRTFRGPVTLPLTL